MKRRLRLALGACVLWGVAIVMAAPAQAHDVLLATEPADGATVSTVPAAVVYTWSSRPAKQYLTARVTPPGQPNRSLGPDQIDLTNGTVTVPLTGGGGSGAWVVTLRIVSADGHPVETTVHFTVAGGAGPASATASGSASGAATSPGSPSAPVTSPTAEPAASTSALPLTAVGIGVVLVLAAAAAGVIIGRRARRRA